MRIPGIFVEVRGDYSFLREDLDKAKTIAKAGAADIANSLNGAMDARGVSTNTNTLINNISKVQSASQNASVDFAALTKSTEGVGGAVGMTDKAFASFQARMLQTKAQEQADKAFNALTKSMGMSRLESAQFHMQMGDTTGGLKILGGMAMSAAPYILAVGAAAIYAGKACFDSALYADRLAKAYQSIEGSGTGARQQLQYIYGEADRLGLQFQTSAMAAKGFFAAGKGTSMEGDLRKIYSSVSEAATALSLGEEEVKGIFRALGQVMSKGKVQAEELRGQIGEHLPGAFNMAAKAMGVTMAELDKMLEQGQVLAEDLLPKLADELHRTYGQKAVEAADGAAQSVNRMSTEWELFKANVMDTDGILGGIRVVTNALKSASDEIVQAELRKQGVKPEGKRSLNWIASVAAGVPIGERDYSSGQIDMQRRYGTTDTAKATSAIMADFEKKEKARQEAELDKIFATSAKYSKEMDGKTDAGRVKLAKAAHEERVRSFQASLGKDQEHADRWRAKITESEQILAADIANIGKKGVASAKKDTREREQITDAYYAYVGTKTEDSLDLMEEAEKRKHDKLVASIQKQYGATAQGQEMLYNLSVAHSEKVEKLYADADKKREDAAKKALEAEQKIANARRDMTEAMQDKMFQATGTDAQKKAAQTEKEIREWREKWEHMGLGTMEEFDSTAAHYREVMGKANDETSIMFRKLWENAIDRVDGAFADMWKSFIKGGKSAMTNFKELFQNMLAEIAHQALTRPIVVQMSGMFTGSSLFGSTAYAGGSSLFGGGGSSSASGVAGAGGSAASGGGPNIMSAISPSWFTPSSWVSSANAWGAETFPSVFGATTSNIAASNTAFANALMSGQSLEAASAAGAAAGQSLMGTLGAMGVAGAIGMFLGNALGDKTGGMSTGGGAAIGAGIGSIVPGVGTIVGGVVGGLAGLIGGSLFGGGKGPRTASNYTQVQTTWGGNFEESASGYAWGSRGADTQSDFAKSMYKWIGDTANTQRAEIKALIDVTDNSAAINAALETTNVAFGHGQRGRDGHSIYEWNVNSDMKANQEAIAAEMQEVLWEGVMQAAQGLDWSTLQFTADMSTTEGVKAAFSKIGVMKGMQESIEALLNPTSQMDQMLAKVNSDFRVMADTLETLGFNTQALTELEEKRLAVIKKQTDAATKSFGDDMTSRYLAMYGTSAEQNSNALRVKHENELASAGSQFGRDSIQYYTLKATQAMEVTVLAQSTAQATLNTAQNNYVSALQSTYTAMKGFASSVKKLREDLLLDKDLSGLSITDRYSTAGSRLDALTARALAGDTEAMAELQDVSRQYLEVSKDYNSDFAAYRRDFDRVQSILSQVETSTSTQADAANAQLTAITGTGAAIVNKLEELRLAFLAAQAAVPTTGTIPGPVTTGSIVDKMYQDNLQRSADTAGLDYWTGQITSGAMSAGAVERAITASTENVNQIYESILGRAGDTAGLSYWTGQLSSGAMTQAQVEAAFRQSQEYVGSHATGGIASGWSIVGEQGPELANFKNPARVYTASQTRAVLGGDGADLAGELRALRQEVAGMRAENERLLTSVAKSAQRTTDTLEKFDFDGLPAEREA